MIPSDASLVSKPRKLLSVLREEEITKQAHFQYRKHDDDFQDESPASCNELLLSFDSR